MTRNSRVLVAMSGGVDSCVAAALLREQGHDVIGVFMRTGVAEMLDEAHASNVSLPIYAPPRERGCCSASDASDARIVAGRLGIPFYALNFREDFERLMDNFADEYVRGRTPNPCVRCNQWLKFGKLDDYAKVVGADLIATGHYAAIRRDADGTRLMRSRDRRKDQSYVLFGLSRDVLSRTLFPIGDLTKDEARNEAKRLGLPVFDKPESQDICFVPDRDYVKVVERRRPGAMRAGDIQHIDGRVVGRHDGVGTFTIGQRRGVRVAEGSPIYVTGIDAETATVTVGPREALESDGLIATDVNWLCEAPTGTFTAHVQIRYHHDAAIADVTPESGGRTCVRFHAPVEAVTPGQAAVFYRDDEVLGGGWIDRAVGN